jgi:hypothetical protein
MPQDPPQKTQNDKEHKNKKEDVLVAFLLFVSLVVNPLASSVDKVLEYSYLT